MESSLQYNTVYLCNACIIISILFTFLNVPDNKRVQRYPWKVLQWLEHLTSGRRATMLADLIDACLVIKYLGKPTDEVDIEYWKKWLTTTDDIVIIIIMKQVNYVRSMSYLLMYVWWRF